MMQKSKSLYTHGDDTSELELIPVVRGERKRRTVKVERKLQRSASIYKQIGYDPENMTLTSHHSTQELTNDDSFEQILSLKKIEVASTDHIRNIYNGFFQCCSCKCIVICTLVLFITLLLTITIIVGKNSNGAFSEPKIVTSILIGKYHNASESIKSHVQKSCSSELLTNKKYSRQYCKELCKVVESCCLLSEQSDKCHSDVIISWCDEFEYCKPKEIANPIMSESATSSISVNKHSWG
mmetsp:Transcript_39187/g.47132  ORF Transcript_39187/g.47132 Transcript_39187/m.47132 type:complete len:239 (+) Transcript_39187:171-887(+)